VRSTSALKIARASATRPIGTARAPKQIALTTSLPHRIPPSIMNSTWPGTQVEEFIRVSL
jgi:hypothetical protein